MEIAVALWQFCQRDLLVYGITVECLNSNWSYPVLIVVRQQKGVLSWQLPLVVDARKELYEYARTSRTLCPDNNYYLPHNAFMLKNNPNDVIVSLSTASPYNLTFSLRVNQEEDFVLNLSEKKNITIYSSEPRYYSFKFPESVETVLLRVDSADDIQNMSAPKMSQKGEEESSAGALSPSWKRPEEVMRIHRLKLKKKALQARMNKSSTPRTPEKNGFGISRGEGARLEESNKRNNPFKINSRKRARYDEEEHSSSLELSSDNTLFQLLNAGCRPSVSSENLQTSFTSALSQLPGYKREESCVEPEKKGEKYIPIDWSLKTKVRFISPKPFAWSQKLRTCEEASGITGFVRCLDTGLDSESSQSLDTSPNARFHQCCLVWQHPALPWVDLFPRTSTRVSASSGIIASSQAIKDCLHREWAESFRSLFQLTRARQCPFFYVCANTFTCLFRAAGILGFTDINAMLTPTTRGFRQNLKNEDVEFIMPLKKSTKRLSSDSTGDTGYNTDSLNDDNTSSKQLTDNLEGLSDDDEPADEWLESMGIAEEEIRKIRSKQTKLEHGKQREVDRTPESLIYVEGVEAQALFNFLMNCKSSIAATGPLAGIPPTLLAPVAFSGATLKSLKVRQSVVKVEKEDYHSMELCGPVLPHAIHNLCGLLEQSLDEFSATFANLESTKAFSLVTDIPEKENDPLDSLKSPEKSNCSSSVRTPTKAPSAFGKENLSDCGLQPSVLARFCCSDTNRILILDSLKLNSDYTYIWS